MAATVPDRDEPADRYTVQQPSTDAVERHVLLVRIAPQRLQRGQRFRGKGPVARGDPGLAQRLRQRRGFEAGTDQDGVEAGIDDLEPRGVVRLA